MEGEKKMNVFEKLMKVQAALKAPKNQYNSFGKYSYRSCEDILEGVKPILSEVGATITLSDNIEVIGDRVYVKAIAVFRDVETGEAVENVAYAREESEKKGMDGAQVTGASSSYARKYCLNGLLLIDDTKDPDTDENCNERNAKSKKQVDAPKEPQGITDSDKRELMDLVEALKEKYPTKSFTFDQFFPEGVDKFTADQFGKAKAQLLGLLNKAAKNG